MLSGFVSFLAFCGLSYAAVPGHASAASVRLASTIGPIDTGIVQALEDAFEQETGIRVRHVGAGTDAALKIARKGSVDLALVHARALEERFVDEGYGTERIDLMYNDFVIMGPTSDPAGTKGAQRAVDALKRISERQAPFVSRGVVRGLCQRV